MVRPKPHGNSQRLSAWCCLGAVALALCGCAGYHVGPTNAMAAGGKSIQVNFFENKTIEPRLVEAVAHAMRKNLQQDGSFKLATRGDPDVVVTGVITDYNRTPLSFQRNDTLTARDFGVVMRAKVTAVERTSGKVVLDRVVTGHTTIRVGDDLPSAERQALPLLAEDLARNTTALLVDGEW